MGWPSDVVGVAKMEGVSEDIVADLRANFEGECSEVGMYLAMSRVSFPRRAIRKSACTGKKLLMKKQNMLQNLLNFSVKL